MGKTNGRLTLKQARDARDWTQQQLAKASELTQGQISEIENGAVKQPNIATMLKLARALGMAVSLNPEAGLVFEEK